MQESVVAVVSGAIDVAWRASFFHALRRLRHLRHLRSRPASRDCLSILVPRSACSTFFSAPASTTTTTTTAPAFTAITLNPASTVPIQRQRHRFTMAKSARASTRKRNNATLRTKVFGPAYDARTERLSNKLQELANAPKPDQEKKMHVDDDVDEDKKEADAHVPAVDEDQGKQVPAQPQTGV